MASMPLSAAVDPGLAREGALCHRGITKAGEATTATKAQGASIEPLGRRDIAIS
eukprot:CAMPEP_0203940114 /NCGR_PEP_ID=MMETSP0359-20131031/76777_1 /ASSEMBLY_ACC=CAM_ASM_000338 /TAXON_ID=268821 /ORGANISM="Scrippsiella Hangoei, Strain SHTV-5" /LENGTH=53 /DNA_ID=CAMNT_0050870515 /DNA_START=35 /DNA_END=193 /DNA_ORIENTATION=-